MALIPIIGLFCDVVFQIAWLRLSGRKSLLRSIYAGFLGGAAAVCATQAVVGGEFAGNLLANLVIYAFLGYGYFHFLNLGETGRRVRLLRELYEAPEGLTLDQILSRYNAKDMLAIRFSRLLHNGQVVLEDGRYRLGRPLLAWISSAIVFLKKVILGRASEFE